MLLRVLLLTLSIVLGHCYNSFTDISKLSPTPLNYSVYTGYIQIVMPTSASESSIFYQYVSKEGENLTNFKSDSPVIIWLEGGPGRSSQFSSWSSFGPFMLDQNNNIKERSQSSRWNSMAHLIMVDQPVSNVGLSFTKNGNYVVNSMQEAAAQFLQFIENLFTKDSLRVLQKNPIYFAGQGHSGHYLPYFIKTLLTNSSRLSLSIQGMLLINPWIKPTLQLKSFHSTLLSAGVADYLNGYRGLLADEAAAAAGLMDSSSSVGQALINKIAFTIPSFLGIDVFNYMKINGDEEYDSRWAKWVISHQQEYGVPVFVKVNPVNRALFNGFLPDIVARSTQSQLVYLLQSNIRVSLISGQNSLMVGPGCVHQVINQMWSWSGLAEWKQNSPKKLWTIGGFVVGNVKDYGGLTVAVVYSSGENINAAQPAAGLVGLSNLLDNSHDWES